MMRILWIHQYFATPAGWGSQRMYEFGRRFAAAGHEIDVLCCDAYDSSLAGKRLVEVAGMRVYVSRVRYRPHMGFARRVWAFLAFMGFCVRHVLRHGRRYDLVVASSGPLTAVVPALFGRWLRRWPFVFEVIDVWPDSAIAAGVVKNPALKWLSRKLESRAYRQAAAIVTCSTGMTERVEKKLELKRVRGSGFRVQGLESRGQKSEVRKKGSSAERRVVTISNCCDLDLFVGDREKRKSLRTKLGVEDGRVVVLYTGAMGVSNAVENLADAVRMTAEDERIVWWFAGDGALAEKLRTTVAGNPSSGRVRWFGKLTRAQVVELYLAADVNVVTFMHAPLFHENSPNKFFDGIAAGLPTVFNRSTWLEPWLKDYGCGVVCTSDDAGAEMARELKLLAADGERRRRMGQGARRLAEEVFSRDKLAVEFLAIVEKASGLERQPVAP